MTPLEMAKKKRKTLSCRNCPKMEVVGNLAYCSVNGKILLPSLLDTCVCRGTRLKGNNE